MTGIYRCGDHAALTGYLYDDCEPGEREAIDAHLQTCAACADELRTLSATRRQLASWPPPETSLGFRIGPADGSPVVPFAAGGRFGVAPEWWRRPLPAWAQMAAALVIFAAGLSIGALRGRADTQASVTPQVQAALSGLERRVSGVERLARQGVRQVPVSQDTPAEAAVIFRQVGHQIAKSEERQRQEWQEELALRMVYAAETQQRKAEEIETNVAKVQNDLTGMLLAFQR